MFFTPWCVWWFIPYNEALPKLVTRTVVIVPGGLGPEGEGSPMIGKAGCAQTSNQLGDLNFRVSKITSKSHALGFIKGWRVWD